jgi:hypothetical protein
MKDLLQIRYGLKFSLRHRYAPQNRVIFQGVKLSLSRRSFSGNTSRKIELARCGFQTSPQKMLGKSTERVTGHDCACQALQQSNYTLNFPITPHRFLQAVKPLWHQVSLRSLVGVINMNLDPLGYIPRFLSSTSKWMPSVWSLRDWCILQLCTLAANESLFKRVFLRNLIP